jgi:hypothetical protein
VVRRGFDGRRRDSVADGGVGESGGLSRSEADDPGWATSREEENGDYHWAIVSVDGTTLAQSGSFASFDDVEVAAFRVRDGAASTRLEVSLPAGRQPRR